MSRLFGIPPAALILLALAAPVSSRAAVTMAHGRTSVPRGFELIDNRIFVSVWINGEGPFKFILDSGAVNFLTLETAQKLGLDLTPAGQQSGAGAGTVESWTTRVDRLSLGDLTLSDPSCYVSSLAPIIKAIGFQRLDGVLGYELFSQLAVELDYQTGNVTFIRPETFTPPQPADVVPFELSGHIPVIEGRVNGIEGRFIVDTGDRSSLTLFRPFVQEHDLTDSLALTPEITTGWGIGGPIPARVTRLDTLMVHDSPVTGVVTRLPTLTSGAFATSEEAGSIGTGVLSRFNVTFDYPHKTMYLVPNASRFRHDSWDGAGMWLVNGDGGIEVYDILPGGPAEHYGLHKGDVIVQVNDIESSRPGALLEVRNLLTDARDGGIVRFRVKDDPGVRVVDVKLKKIL